VVIKTKLKQLKKPLQKLKVVRKLKSQLNQRLENLLKKPKRLLRKKLLKKRKRQN